MQCEMLRSKTEKGGFEPPTIPRRDAGKAASDTARWSSRWTEKSDSDLDRLAAAWSGLDARTRRAILALADIAATK